MKLPYTRLHFLVEVSGCQVERNTSEEVGEVSLPVYQAEVGGGATLAVITLTREAI